jgi:restriction system protein
MYNRLIYKIVLRTIHELYEADAINVIESIVFNGWVNSIDKATGQETNTCIISVQTSKDEFVSINLKNVDPKACFKKLKGVGSTKLHNLSPVAPIMQIDREDTNFVSVYDVTDALDEPLNLATMDWEDFEHLIGDVIEKEFIEVGGEVKITGASRDDGIDAVAFDPDPRDGGKIIIKVKRYANVVGVSAVRDLYGTVVKEGATRGILVTTTDYGPDAHDFAKGKPITLLNEGNLLHLLDRHGYTAKIDIKKAKKLRTEK